MAEQFLNILSCGYIQWGNQHTVAVYRIAGIYYESFNFAIQKALAKIKLAYIFGFILYRLNPWLVIKFKNSKYFSSESKIARFANISSCNKFPQYGRNAHLTIDNFIDIRQSRGRGPWYVHIHSTTWEWPCNSALHSFVDATHTLTVYITVWSHDVTWLHQASPAWSFEQLVAGLHQNWPSLISPSLCPLYVFTLQYGCGW